MSTLYRYVIPGLDAEPHLVEATPRTVDGTPMARMDDECMVPARHFFASLPEAKADAAARLIEMVQPVLHRIATLRKESQT